MARSRKGTDKPVTSKRRIEQYNHEGQQRRNNPPVGLVTEVTDRDSPKNRYAYDPHLDPTLTWAGKVEHTSFELPTVSLHVRERIDPKTIVEAVRRRNGTPAPVQGSLFESAEENPPLREAIDFYQLDPDYDSRSLFPGQVFFPMADEVSLPFEAGAHKRAAVKIVDDRGIESLKVIPTP